MEKRLLSIIVDLIVCILLTFILAYASFWVIGIPYTFFILLFLKDIVNGQSIGKRLMKIRVLKKDGSKPSPRILVLRNLTLFIWFVDAYLYFSKGERLGDILFKTTVCDVSADVSSALAEAPASTTTSFF